MSRNPLALDPTMAKIAAQHYELYLREMHHIQDQADELNRLAQKSGGYNLARLLDAQANHEVHRRAPLELEISERIAEKLGRPPHHGYAFVPVSSHVLALSQRDLSVGSAGAGGYLVAATNPGDVFVAALRNASIMERLGVTRFPVVANALVPRATGSVSTQWLVTEGTSITESQHVFAAAAGTPKSVAAYCEVSGQLLTQTTPAGQSFILSEMARAVAEACGNALASGSGAAGEPTGINNTTGIGAQSGTSLAWSGVLNMVEAVETAKGLVSPESAGWAVNPTSAEILRGRERAAGNGYIMDGNSIAGYRALSTGSMPAGTMLFGDWSRIWQLEWGVLELGADPYGMNSALFTKNLVGLRAIWSVDFLVLSPASFCAATSIT